MGTCGSKNVKKTVATPKRLNKNRKDDDEMTQVDLERLLAEKLQREKQEDELTRLIYAEKAALREITSRLIVKRASCESLMDLLEPTELLDISLDDASFRAQKRYRRKALKRSHCARKNEWILYNNLDGIREPHMVHLAFFMQKVTATLARIEAAKSPKLLPPQLGNVGNNAGIASRHATSTPPSSPATVAKTQRKGGRKVYQADSSHSLLGQEDEGGDYLELPPDAAGTLATVNQQNRLEEEYRLSQLGKEQMPAPPSTQGEGESNNNATFELQPPSPPPSLTGSPRSMPYSPYSPGSPSIGNANSQYSILTGASLALRLGELLSPEDEQQLTEVVQASQEDMFADLRTHKSSLYPTVLMSAEDQEKYRRELLNLQVCIIAPQTSYDITPENLYDYDLPPGLVTMRVARTVLNLYRRGGRLTPKSVLKLLRLGYRSLQKRPNTTHITVEPGDNLTVVGDLHGQLPDLLHILETAGLPSKTNKYIFNGDFVDRGSYGVEVMCSLLALHIALPDHVILNRGNHEDFAICTVYGFQLECCEKYGDVIFGLFVEIFQQLPLFAVVNQSVIVLHGGLFHTADTTLEELDKIDRSAFSLQDLPDGGDSLVPIPRDKNAEFLKQLVRDALWSDPADHEGLLDSVRGAGVSFGPDVTRKFLRANNLQFVVRSHECVKSGYDEPYNGKDKHLLCTIFSASDYGGSGNSAAFLMFHVPSAEELTALTADHTNSAHSNLDSSNTTNLSAEEESGRSVLASASNDRTVEDILNSEDNGDDVSEVKYVVGTNLCYTVHFYYVAPTFFEDNKESALWESTHGAAATDPATAAATAANTAANSASSPNGASIKNNATEEEKEGGGDLRRRSSRSASLRGGLGARRGSVEDIGNFDVIGPMPGTVKRSKSITSGAGLLCSPLKEEEDETHDEPPSFTVSDKDCVLIGSRMALHEFIMSRLKDLQAEFEGVDKKHSGVVSKYQWVNVMREVMSLHIRWVALMQVLVRESHFRIYHGKKMIDYMEFLHSFQPAEDVVSELGESSELVNDEFTDIGSAGANSNHENTKAEGNNSHLPPLLAVTKSGEVLELDHLADHNAGSGSRSTSPTAATAATTVTGFANGATTATTAANTEVFSNASSNKEDYIPDSAISPLSLDSVNSNNNGANPPLSTNANTSTSHNNTDGDNTADAESPRKRVSFAGPAESNNNNTINITTDNANHNSSTNNTNTTNTSPQRSPRNRRASDSLLRSLDPPSPDSPLTPSQMYCNHKISPGLMEVLYIDYKEVESAFHFFDRNHDGFISTSEFRAACRELNKHLPKGEKIKDVEAIIMLMDIEETGEIAFNSFFELFRLSEMKLNVGIDEEDTLMSSLHHSEQKDIIRHQSMHSISNYGNFGNGPLSPNRLAFHGVEINVDSEFSSPKANGMEKLGRAESINQPQGDAGKEHAFF